MLGKKGLFKKQVRREGDLLFSYGRYIQVKIAITPFSVEEFYHIVSSQFDSYRPLQVIDFNIYWGSMQNSMNYSMLITTSNYKALIERRPPPGTFPKIQGFFMSRIISGFFPNGITPFYGQFYPHKKKDKKLSTLRRPS